MAPARTTPTNRPRDEMFNLLKWPFAAVIWLTTGLFVSVANIPTIVDNFVNVGQSLSIPLALFFALFVGISIAWLIFRYNMISVRLYSEYLSRQRQLYRAPVTARKKLQKSWGNRP